MALPLVLDLLRAKHLGQIDDGIAQSLLELLKVRSTERVSICLRCLKGVAGYTSVGRQSYGWCDQPWDHD